MYGFRHVVNVSENFFHDHLKQVYRNQFIWDDHFKNKWSFYKII